MGTPAEEGGGDNTGVIAVDQPVTLNGTGLIQAEGIVMGMAMNSSYGNGFGSCTPHSGKKVSPTEAQFQALFGEIQKNPLGSNIQSLWLQIDGNNRGDESLENRIEVFWEDGDTFRVSIGIGNMPTTVTDVSGTFPIPPFKLEFTGGRMRVKNGTGKVQEHYWLNCAMDDVITIDVTLE